MDILLFVVSERSFVIYENGKKCGEINFDILPTDRKLSC